ncbi:MAG: hypothetical protein BGO69_04790 [Bacteroidetes bacterium 46-16]|nr:MAG: hypothetical protein BGO69_04790 [Bacteroidetes bacterium 46-16]
MAGHKLVKFLRSRLFRNILFWIFILLQVLNNNDEDYYYDPDWYFLFIAINIFLLIFLTYANNLFLAPRLLLKKKYFRYAFTLLLFTCCFSILYVAIQKTILSFFPRINIYQVSLISGPVSTIWNIKSLLLESIQYCLIYLIWQFIFTMAWFMNIYVRHEKKIEQAQKKQVESELNFLKSQINPHFLFNNLNNLYALSIKNSDKTSEAILQISSLLRYMLYEANAQYIPFYKEKEVIEAYINLELLRFSEVKNFTFNISADRAYNIPPLLWLPVLENVFKHGTRIIAEEYYVEYTFTIKDGQMKIYSKNYYKNSNLSNEITPYGNDQKPSGGIGFTNLRKRLELLYPWQHTIHTSRDGQFYIVDIQIDLTHEYTND